MCNKILRSRNKHRILGVARSTLSAIERIPVALVDLMKWGLAFSGLGVRLLVCSCTAAAGPRRR